LKLTDEGKALRTIRLSSALGSVADFIHFFIGESVKNAEKDKKKT
jgi:hypothetical protein